MQVDMLQASSFVSTTCHVETKLTVVEVSDTISAAIDFAHVWSGFNEAVAGTGLC